MDLVGYLFNAIPEEERQRIESELARRPELRAELEQLRRQILDPLQWDDDVEPPPGLADQTIAAIHDPVMSAVVRDSFAPNTPIRFFDVAVTCSMLLFGAFLILPAIASLRGDEARLICSDKLRQIGTALASYQVMERGELPAGDPAGPLNHAGVFSLLLQARDLLPEAKVLICPMADSAVVYVPRLTEYLAAPTGSVVQKLQRKEMGGSFGYSLGHQVEGDHVGPSEAGEYAPLLSDRPPREGEDRKSKNSPNHGGWGQNVLFADGHVQWHGTPYLGRDELFANRNGTIGAGLDRTDTCIGVSEAVPYPPSN